MNDICFKDNNEKRYIDIMLNQSGKWELLIDLKLICTKDTKLECLNEYNENWRKA